MSNFRTISVQANEKKFADPLNINHTLKVSVNSAPKVSGAVSLVNVREEYVEAAILPVTNGTDNGVENASVRISVSGSTQNAVALRAMAVNAFSNFLLIMDDRGTQGFIPEVTLVATPNV